MAVTDLWRADRNKCLGWVRMYSVRAVRVKCVGYDVPTHCTRSWSQIFEHVGCLPALLNNKDTATCTHIG